MVKTRLFSFIWARDASGLSGVQRWLFWIWNGAALLLSSALIAVLSLLLALGTYDYATFWAYFSNPLLVLLNFLPVFLLQLLLLCLTGRQWAAYLGCSLIVLLASIGNFYKISIRYSPFYFADIRLIGAALGIASRYDLFPPGARVLLAFAAIPAGTLLLYFLVRGRPANKLRLSAGLCVLVSLFPLWHFVYSDKVLYEFDAAPDYEAVVGWRDEKFIVRGFVYPFLHSISYRNGTVPENYDRQEAEALLEQYEDAAIPDSRKVNLLVMQLESFCDLERFGLSGISPEAYAYYHALEQEGYSGNLIANVYGGSTIDTERCFLTGSYFLSTYISSRSYSHVRYLRSQGYRAIGGHPNVSSFYSRAGTNSSLGFEDYWFVNDVYPQDQWGAKSNDETFMADVLDQYRRYEEEGQPVFSFNVTLQGHGPYRSERDPGEPVYWTGEGFSEPVRNRVNSYLESVMDTQENLRKLVDSLREDRTPVVLLIYGDHKPALIHEICDGDRSSPTGFYNYYSTRYLFWANDAAREQLGEDFTGQGPDVSAGFLMNLVFDKLGWPGNAFIQFGDTIRQTLPVITSLDTYCENGKLTTSLSPQGQEAFRQLKEVLYYIDQNYSSSSQKD